ncbi:hypothetical protein BROUX41_002919 [Berkeleyomyces rouxiae]|uniref:uncharacterized protein n=1 Tax=Berkeleyomyces rouxiae TaxID=2035830 RepID=UPI003B7F6F74
MNTTPLIPGQRLLVRKRPRNIDDDASDFAAAPHTGFGEHRSKRLNCQPLAETTFTGVAAVPDGFDFASGANVTLAPEPLYSNVEQLARQDPQSSFANQIPTPVDTSFPTQHRSWSGPGPAISYLNGSRQFSNEHEAIAYHNVDDTTSIPRTIETDPSWANVHSHNLDQSGLPSPELSFGGASQEQANVDIDMDYEQSPEREFPPQMQVPILQEPSSPSQDSSSSPSWKGHNRSRHTVNSWTWQPGMKRSFSIGYCSDCEKCQMKVPGHFNHIVI